MLSRLVTRCVECRWGCVWVCVCVCVYVGAYSYCRSYIFVPLILCFVPNTMGAVINAWKTGNSTSRMNSLEVLEFHLTVTCSEFWLEWKSNNVLDRIPESQSQDRNFSFPSDAEFTRTMVSGTWPISLRSLGHWNRRYMSSVVVTLDKSDVQQTRDVFTRTLALSQQKIYNFERKKSIICVLSRTYSAIVFTPLECYLVCSIVTLISKIFCHFYSISSHFT